jgi:glycosyltransferase involved in cell wall biosynthesis
MRAKTRCVYNSIDAEFIRRRAEQLGSSGNCLKADVVSVGRLVAIKKYEILIEALGILAREGLHPKLAIVGGSADQTNPYYLRLKDQAAGLGLSDYIFFTDYVPEPYGIIANADASVLCCTNEGFGLVVLESMACRTAVIVADAGGLTELVEHDKDGLKFSADNPVELAKCLRMLLLDKSRAHRLADQAYKKVAQDFDVDSHMRSLNRNFLAVLGKT